MMSDEWGPWIEHDGRGCPCIGEWCRAEFKYLNGMTEQLEGRAGSMGGHSWVWGSEVRCAKIIRYRIRKPRGMTILQELIENLPADGRVKEGELA